MIKMIVLLLGLAVGFGGGVYWGVHHPDDARKLSDAEERKVLEKQKELLAKLKGKLDQLASSGAASTAGRSGILGAAQGGKADPEIDRLKAESDQQMNELDKLLKK